MQHIHPGALGQSLWPKGRCKLPHAWGSGGAAGASGGVGRTTPRWRHDIELPTLCMAAADSIEAIGSSRDMQGLMAQALQLSIQDQQLSRSMQPKRTQLEGGVKGGGNSWSDFELEYSLGANSPDLDQDDSDVSRGDSGVGRGAEGPGPQGAAARDRSHEASTSAPGHAAGSPAAARSRQHGAAPKRKAPEARPESPDSKAPSSGKRKEAAAAGKACEHSYAARQVQQVGKPQRQQRQQGQPDASVHLDSSAAHLRGQQRYRPSASDRPAQLRAQDQPSPSTPGEGAPADRHPSHQQQQQQQQQQQRRLTNSKSDDEQRPDGGHGKWRHRPSDRPVSEAASPAAAHQRATSWQTSHGQHQPRHHQSSGRRYAGALNADPASARGHGGSRPAHGPVRYWYSDRTLTREITLCADVTELLHFWEDHGARFNGFHVAAMIHRLAKAAETAKPDSISAMRPVLDHLDASFRQHLPGYSAREVCMSVWAWGKLSHRPSNETWAAVRAALLSPGGSGAVEGEGLAGRGVGQPGAAPDGVGPRAGVPLGLLSSATPQALAMLVWGLYQVSCSDDDVWLAMEAACREHMAALQPRDLANVAWAYASAGRHSISLFCELAAAAVPRAPDFTPQDLANMAWAFASVGHPNRPLFDAVAAAASRILHGFTPQGLSNLLWGFARADVPAPQLFEDAVREIRNRLPQFEPGHLTMTAWAYARSGHGNAAVMSAISGAVQVNMQAFKSKELVLVLWSFAFCGHHEDAMFSLAPPILLGRANAGSLNWQDMGLSLWALAVANKSSVQVSEAFSKACLEGFDSFAACTPALDTVISALAIAGHYHPQLCDKVAEALQGTSLSLRAREAGELEGVEEEESADDVLALSVGRWQGPAGASAQQSMLNTRLSSANTSTASNSPASQALMEALPSASSTSGAEPAAPSAAAPALQVNPLQAANLLSSLARLNHRHPGACLAMAREMTAAMKRSPDEVPVPALAKCLWSFAVMDHRDLSFARAAAMHCSKLEAQESRSSHLDRGTLRLVQQQQQRVRDLLELQVTGGRGKASGEWTQALEQGMWALQQPGGPWHKGMPRVRETMQLLQAALWLEDMRSADADQVLQQMPRELLLEASTAWRLAAFMHPAVSALQLNVHDTLRDHMQLKPQMEVRTDDQMFSVDMVVTWRGQAVAIEVNGPTHYVHNVDGSSSAPAEGVACLSQLPGGGAAVCIPCVPVPRHMGYKQLRDRFLAARGMRVLNLSWMEWRAVERSPAEACAYMATLLDAAVEAPPPGPERRRRAAAGGGRKSASDPQRRRPSGRAVV